LFQDNHAVEPPGSPVEGYHLSEDLADRAIRYLGEIRSAAPDVPFFLYFATGACHSPHHAPRPWIDRYSGSFDAGWDQWREQTFERQMELGLFREGTSMSERPPWVPAWDSLAADDRRVAARFMECFAGFLSHADAQIGRVLEFIRALGEWDNTLVIVVSDNGASAEGGQLGSINDVRTWNASPAGPDELRARIDELGGPSAHNNYPWGWTMAGNTPFRRWKREVHQGGIADPCIVSWAARIPSDGSVRRQFAHAIDIVPTILDLVGADAPSAIFGVPQSPIEGVSLVRMLEDASAADVHQTQYFEMLGSRGIYHRGWKAVTFHPFVDLYGEGRDPDASFDDDQWELYNVADDPAETRDLASTEPDRLAEMIRVWWAEAEKYKVLPLDNRLLEALVDPRHQPPDRRRQVIWPDGAIVPELQVINVRNRAHLLTVHVAIPEGGAEGVMLAMGTALGGWSLHVLGGRLRYVNNFLGSERHVIEAAEELRPGRHVLSFQFEPIESNAFHRPGLGRLSVDGVQVAEGVIERTAYSRYSITGGGLTCGWEQGPAVGHGYEAPFRFTGELHHAEIAVDGEALRDPQAEFEAIMSEQ
jgi:arylsulfatase